MITQCDATIVLDIASIHEKHAVIEYLATFVEGQPPQVIMVDVDRLANVYKLRKPRQNSEFARIYENGGMIMIRIIALTDTLKEAHRTMIERIRSYRAPPICNAKGVSFRSVGRPIICVTTGEEYPNQRIAADALGIHQSAISRHMNGELKQAQGYVFKYK